MAGGLDERPLFWHFPAYLQSYQVTHEQRDPLFRTRPCSVIRMGRFKLHEYFEDGALELYDLVDVLEDQGSSADLVEGAGALDESLIAIESQLIQLRSTGTGQDGVRYPSKVVGQLRHLANGVGTADFRPADQQGEVQVLLRDHLMNAREELETILSEDLAAFNRLLAERGLNPLISE